MGLSYTRNIKNIQNFCESIEKKTENKSSKKVKANFVWKFSLELQVLVIPGGITLEGFEKKYWFYLNVWNPLELFLKGEWYLFPGWNKAILSFDSDRICSDNFWQAADIGNKNIFIEDGKNDFYFSFLGICSTNPNMSKL